MEIEIKPLTANIEIVVGDGVSAEQLNSLQNQIAELKAEKARLEALVKEMQGENAELQAEILQADNKINRLTEELNSANGNNEALQAEINNLHLQITQLENQINVLNIEKAELQAQIDNTQAQIEGLQNQITQLSADWGALNGEEVENASAYALETKSAIAEAITSKGGTITPETTFRAYADEINNFSLEKKGDKHTLLLLHFDESTTKDSSIYADRNVIKEYGSPSLNTSIKKFGNSSLYLNGSSNLYLQDKAFPYMNGNVFTIEFWLYNNETSTSFTYAVFGQATSTSNGHPRGWCFGRLATTISEMRLACGSAWSVGIPYSQITTKQWHHIAISKNVDKAYAFLDGALITQKDLSSNSNSYSVDFGHTHFSIGSLYWNGTFGLRGYIDEFRISDVCRYKESFTPPTEPFTI